MASDNRAARSVTRRRLWALVLACVATLGIVASGSVQPTATEASWTSADQTKAAFVAITVPPPVITADGCTASATGGGTLGLGPLVTVTWQLPASPTGVAYTVSNVAFGLGAGGLGSLVPLTASSVSTSGPSGGVYTTKYSGSVLSGLLSATFTVALWVVDPSGWKSHQVGYTASIGLLGLGTSCVLQAAS
jgi:hypothetical protein